MAAVAATSLAAGPAPRLAMVDVGGAEVRCGPGDDYYVVDRLPAGRQIEIYHEQADGWCAIRPPAGSFSLVPARQVQLTDGDSLAEVIAEDAVSWVGGAATTDASLCWQVQLDVGEIVEIVGVVRRSEQPEGPRELWYKIAPPAGEFRWMHAEQLSLHVAGRPGGRHGVEDALLAARQAPRPALEAVDPPRLEPAPASAPRIESVAAQPELAQPELAQPELAQPELAETDDARLSVRDVRELFVGPSLRPTARLVAAELDDSTAGDAASGESTANWRRRSESRVAASPFREVKVAASASGASSPATVARDAREGDIRIAADAALPADDTPPASLTDVQTALLSLAAADPLTWRFDELRQQVRRLVAEGDHDQQTAARALLVRIEEFASVQERAERLRVGPGTAAFASAGSAAAAATATPSSEGEIGAGLAAAESSSTRDGARPAVDPAYDGVGFLMPVVSRDPSAPPFALLDADGAIVQYVTPAPGLNLRRYVKQEIGVFGQRGYLTTLKSPHLMAGRVVVLDRHR